MDLKPTYVTVVTVVTIVTVVKVVTVVTVVIFFAPNNLFSSKDIFQ